MWHSFNLQFISLRGSLSQAEDYTAKRRVCFSVVAAGRERAEQRWGQGCHGDRDAMGRALERGVLGSGIPRDGWGRGSTHGATALPWILSLHHATSAAILIISLEPDNGFQELCEVTACKGSAQIMYSARVQ